MGKKAVGAAEEEDGNAMKTTAWRMALVPCKNDGLTRLPSWDPRFHVIWMGTAPTVACYTNCGIRTIHS